MTHPPRRQRAARQNKKHEPASGGGVPPGVGMAKVPFLLAVPRQRVNGVPLSFYPLVSGVGTAIPTSFLRVLLPINRYNHAGGQGWDIEKLGLWAVGRRPVVVAASDRRADLLERLTGNDVADVRIGLDVLGRIVIEWPAGLLIDALGPIDLHIGLGKYGLAVAAFICVEKAIARRMSNDLSRLPSDIAVG